MNILRQVVVEYECVRMDYVDDSTIRQPACALLFFRYFDGAVGAAPDRLPPCL